MITAISVPVEIKLKIGPLIIAKHVIAIESESIDKHFFNHIWRLENDDWRLTCQNWRLETTKWTSRRHYNKCMRWYSARAPRWCWQFLLLQCKLWACRTKTQMEFFMCVINTYTKYVIVWLINCHRKYPMNFSVPNNHWKFSIWLNPGKKLVFPVRKYLANTKNY